MKSIWKTMNGKQESDILGVHLNQEEYRQMRNMILNQDTDWNVIFDLFS